MAIGPALRMAGTKVFNFLRPGTGSNIDKLFRFGPDLGFGVLAAAQTPGDLIDKTIAFGGTAGGGLIGGLTMAGTARHFGKGRMKPEDLAQLMQGADLVGTIAGDFAGYPIAEQATRMKDALAGGRGETGFERLGRKQQEQMRAQMEAEILRQYGLIPGTRSDDYLRQLGLG